MDKFKKIIIAIGIFTGLLSAQYIAPCLVHSGCTADSTLDSTRIMIGANTRPVVTNPHASINSRGNILETSSGNGSTAAIQIATINTAISFWDSAGNTNNHLWDWRAAGAGANNYFGVEDCSDASSCIYGLFLRRYNSASQGIAQFSVVADSGISFIGAGLFQTASNQNLMTGTLRVNGTIDTNVGKWLYTGASGIAFDGGSNGVFFATVTGNNGFCQNSASGTFDGCIANPSAGNWALGYSTASRTLATSVLTWDTTGLVTGAKTIAIQGSAPPVAGTSMEMDYGALTGYGRVFAYDRTNSVYRNIRIGPSCNFDSLGDINIGGTKDVFAAGQGSFVNNGGGYNTKNWRVGANETVIADDSIFGTIQLSSGTAKIMQVSPTTSTSPFYEMMQNSSLHRGFLGKDNLAGNGLLGTGGAAYAIELGTIDNDPAILFNNNIEALRISGSQFVSLTGSFGFSNVLMSKTAPTISSGFGTSPSVSSNNGTAAFFINVGTGGTSLAGVIGLPTANSGWICFCNDTVITSISSYCKQTTSSANTAKIANFNFLGSSSAWSANDILAVSCFAY